ncbi:MAG: COG1361 S-layer family protein [Lachnospiraceae bacterium]
MSEWKKKIKTITAIMLAILVIGTGQMTSGERDVKASDITESQIDISVPDNKVPTYEYNKAQDFLLNITNTGIEDIKNFVIEPVLEKDDNQKWPFKTDYQNYAVKVDKLEAEKTVQVKFNFTERDDIPTARYTIHFEYTADNGISGSNSFYVNTTAKPVENKKQDTNNNKKSKVKSPKSSNGASAGGFSNDGAIYSDGGGGEISDGSIPRVIVTGFSTNPEKVKAGSDFTLTIHLRNTSKKTRVKNMLFDLTSPEEGMDEQTTAPAFLPSSGSSSIYLEGMKAGGTADISIKLNAKSDLLQKPYSVELSMKYEDANSNSVETTSSISIPVKQDARFEFSDFEINPESIAVDDEANVMCNLYNLGRIKLYNVKAVFEGEGIEKEEIFVGNVESGATASIDAMLKGIQATEGPVPVTMTMSYENEEGEVSTEEKELMLEVTEAVDESMDMDMAIEEEPKGGFPVIPVIAAIVLLGITAAVIIMKKRRKKRSMDEEEELLYELDGSSEDERQ